MSTTTKSICLSLLVAAVSCTKSRNSDSKSEAEGNAVLIFDDTAYTYTLEYLGTTNIVEPVFTQVQTPQVFLLSEASSTSSNEGSSSTVYPIYNITVTGKTHRCEGKSVPFSDRMPINCTEGTEASTTTPQVGGGGCTIGSAATIDGVSSTLEDNAGQLQISFDPAQGANPAQLILKSVSYTFGSLQVGSYLPSNFVVKGVKVAANTGSLSLSKTNTTFVLAYTVNNIAYKIGSTAGTTPLSGTAPNAVYSVALESGVCIGKYKSAAAATSLGPGFIILAN